MVVFETRLKGENDGLLADNGFELFCDCLRSRGLYKDEDEIRINYLRNMFDGLFPEKCK